MNWKPQSKGREPELLCLLCLGHVSTLNREIHHRPLLSLERKSYPSLRTLPLLALIIIIIFAIALVIVIEEADKDSYETVTYKRVTNLQDP